MPFFALYRIQQPTPSHGLHPPHPLLCICTQPLLTPHQFCFKKFYFITWDNLLNKTEYPIASGGGCAPRPSASEIQFWPSANPRSAPVSDYKSELFTYDCPQFIDKCNDPSTQAYRLDKPSFTHTNFIL